MQATAFVETFGTFRLLPDFLTKLELSPAAKAVYTVLANFKNSYNEAYVCRAKLKEKTNLAKTTISTAVTELVKFGLLKRLKKKKHGRYPLVEFSSISVPENGVSKHVLMSTDLKTHELANANPQLKEQLKIKETTTEEIKKPDDALLLKIEEKLKYYKVNNRIAQKLMDEKPLEVNKQIESLEFHLSQGKIINSKAGWLVKAINENWDTPKGLAQEEERKPQALPKIEPEESLEKAIPKERKKHELEIEREKRIEQVKNIIPKETQERILKEELEFAKKKHSQTEESPFLMAIVEHNAWQRLEKMVAHLNS